MRHGALLLCRALLATAAAALVLVFILGHGGGYELARFPSNECSAFLSWLDSSRWRADALAEALPAAPADPLVAPHLREAAADALHWLRWPPGLRFAAYRPHTLEQVLASPSLQSAGALLLVLPGPSAPRRRAPGQAFLTVSPGSNLTSALPLRALDAAANALEALRGGRRLHAFSLETAHLPLCVSASGACALWEAGSGRIVLHRGLARRIAQAQHLPALLQQFVGGFVEQLVDQLHASSANMTSGNSNPEVSDAAGGAGALGEVFAGAAAAALLAAAAAAPALWWCLLCPVVLGLAAPFLFNFGLTAAAEQVCATLQLPGDECADLWWGAFALALVLSLASAVPIVYLCRLPDCARRRPAPMAAAAAT